MWHLISYINVFIITNTHLKGKYKYGYTKIYSTEVINTFLKIKKMALWNFEIYITLGKTTEILVHLTLPTYIGQKWQKLLRSSIGRTKSVLVYDYFYI